MCVEGLGLCRELGHGTGPWGVRHARVLCGANRVCPAVVGSTQGWEILPCDLSMLRIRSYHRRMVRHGFEEEGKARVFIAVIKTKRQNGTRLFALYSCNRTHAYSVSCAEEEGGCLLRKLHTANDTCQPNYPSCHGSFELNVMGLEPTLQLQVVMVAVLAIIFM